MRPLAINSSFSAVIIDTSIVWKSLGSGKDKSKSCSFQRRRQIATITNPFPSVGWWTRVSVASESGRDSRAGKRLKPYKQYEKIPTGPRSATGWREDKRKIAENRFSSHSKPIDEDAVSKCSVCVPISGRTSGSPAAGQIKASTQKKWKNSIDCLFFIRTLEDIRSRWRKNLLPPGVRLVVWKKPGEK